MKFIKKLLLILWAMLIIIAIGILLDSQSTINLKSVFTDEIKADSDFLQKFAITLFALLIIARALIFLVEFIIKKYTSSTQSKSNEK